MNELVEYIKIYFINDNVDLEELENHLSMNGYDFGIDTRRNILFVPLDDLAFVGTILTDRNISYGVSTY